MIYAYNRISTDEQCIERQLVALKEWQEANNIIVPEENIFSDIATGKNFVRENYIALKELLKQGDYLVLKELDRLGRNWDAIKREWRELTEKGVKIIVIDMPLISDTLKKDTNEVELIDKRLIKEIVFTLLCYNAQKEVEKMSKRTKEGMENARRKGKIIGRPTGQYTNISNFIKTLKLQIDGESFNNSIYKTKIPRASFSIMLRNYRKKYKVHDKEKLLPFLEKEEEREKV